MDYTKKENINVGFTNMVNNEKIETFSASMKSAGKNSLNFEDVQADNVNIADQLQFTQDEKIQMKGDELDY